MVGGVVGLELLVGRVLHVDWVVSDDWGHRGVVAHHCLCTLLAAQFQKGLQEEAKRNIMHKIKIVAKVLSCFWHFSCCTIISTTSI